jgi:hypothetical protein
MILSPFSIICAILPVPFFQNRFDLCYQFLFVRDIVYNATTTIQQTLSVEFDMLDKNGA